MQGWCCCRGEEDDGVKLIRVEAWEEEEEEEEGVSVRKAGPRVVVVRMG